ncbi:TAXI family TRAP transporter solute-binding subunit [Nocardioides zeae]|uniref:TRAP transporter TAXI family solute receptor n=1 Tax=Nocardioides zeae TaxID=1457234 RepID=A0AAJ1U213_9ACTN|nr:TAXI family TRAP transporter solute-binding subunit [Nocardioides zeae]MDQ1105929.1 TRAP transporter TAXI family solute receptor [Nocardioides zeae]
MTGRVSRRGLVRAAGGTALVAGLAGLGPAVASSGTRRSAGDLVVAGGELGGSFTRFARLLGGELRDSGPVGHVRVVASGGSLDNLALLRSGSADLAPSLADAVAVDADAAVAVARLYQTTLHCLVRDGSPFRSAGDLAGRRVAVGPLGSGSAETARRLLEPTLGVDLRAASHATGAVALAGGSVDALLWWGGQPSPELASLVRTHPLRALDLGALVDATRGPAAPYQSVRLPRDVWDQADDVRTAGVAVHLLCRPALDDATVAHVVDTLLAAGPQLVPQPSGGLQYLAPASLFDTYPVPLHPAAARRYRERHG